MLTQMRSGENPSIGCPHGSLSSAECERCSLENEAAECVRKNEPVIVKLPSGAYERDWKATKIENGTVALESRGGKKMEADAMDFIKWQERKEESVYFDYEFVNDFQLEVFHDDRGEYAIAFRTIDSETLQVETADLKNGPIMISSNPEDARKVFAFAKQAALNCFNSDCLRRKLGEYMKQNIFRTVEHKKAA